jgi:hypothetical protein
MTSQLSLNQRNSQLAFCLDSGTVGVVDLSTKQITRMKTSHDNVCIFRISDACLAHSDKDLCNGEVHSRSSE